MTDFDVQDYLSFWVEEVNNFLDKYLSADMAVSKGLIEVMRYSLFAGGKRLRPALTYATYTIFDSDFKRVTPFASAIELVHTYSLIHDDLPSMDNDDLRRGKPTCHKVFGEANAILAGDALLTKAFELMSDKEINSNIGSDIICEAVYKLAKAIGDCGMVAGQYMDINAINEDNYNKDKLVEDIHLHKTATLIAYSMELGVVIANGSNDDKLRIKQCGEKLGLAYQITDDILDIEATVQEMGKGVRKDSLLKKITYPAVKGLEESKKITKSLMNEAFNMISIYGNKAVPLKEIGKFIIDRGK